MYYIYIYLYIYIYIYIYLQSNTKLAADSRSLAVSVPEFWRIHRPSVLPPCCWLPWRASARSGLQVAGCGQLMALVNVPVMAGEAFCRKCRKNRKNGTTAAKNAWFLHISSISWGGQVDCLMQSEWHFFDLWTLLSLCQVGDLWLTYYISLDIQSHLFEEVFEPLNISLGGIWEDFGCLGYIYILPRGHPHPPHKKKRLLVN